MANDASPLILTLCLEESAARYFADLRQTHFPPELNIVPAHVTLFHHLPGAQIEGIVDTLKRECEAVNSVKLEVTGLQNLGRGIAFRLASRELSALRRRLETIWKGELTRQDSQPFRPHVTVQNKVSKESALLLLAHLQASFRPWTMKAVGLDLWRYLGGPWEHLAFFGFDELH